MKRDLLILLTLLLWAALGLTHAQDGDGDPPPIATARLEPTATAPPPETTADATGEVAITATIPVTGTPSLEVTVVTEEPLPITTTPGITATIPSTPTPAGSPTPTIVPIPLSPDEFRGLVDVESALVRSEPSFDGDFVASAFRNQSLDIIGRSADGTWFLVSRFRRPDQVLGWVNREVVDYEFFPEFLPLRDTTTGVIGSIPITERDQFGIWIVEGVVLRTLPDRLQGERILNIPPNVVVPALAQSRGGEWLKVNYLGTEGWIIAFTTRPREGTADLPSITGLVAGDDIVQTILVVPPEIQLEQLNRFRAEAQERLALAQDLEFFWWQVSRGEIFPCNPPGSIQAYQYGTKELRELPEIDRYAPRFNEGVGLINESITTLTGCGVIEPPQVVKALSAAINARIIIENTLVQLDNLERRIPGR